MMKIAGENRSMANVEEVIIDLDPIQMIQANLVHRIEEAGKEKLEKIKEVLITDLIIPIMQNEQIINKMLPKPIWIDNILYGFI
jgi:hypothetical protein